MALNKKTVKQIMNMIEDNQSHLSRNRFSDFLMVCERTYSLDVEDLKLIIEFFVSNLQINIHKLISMMTNIPVGLFSGNKLLKDVKFKGELHESCFQESSVETLDLLITEGNIPLNVAANCENLRSVTIKGACERIESGAFKNCKNLASVDIPDTVKFISKDSFEGCDPNKLEIHIPDSIIDNITFEGVPDLNDENDDSPLMQFYLNTIVIDD